MTITYSLSENHSVLPTPMLAGTGGATAVYESKGGQRKSKGRKSKRCKRTMCKKKIRGGFNPLLKTPRHKSKRVRKSRVLLSRESK